MNVVKLISQLMLYSALIPFEPKADPVPIKVLTEHLPPYQIHQQGQVSGLATEIVRRVFEIAQLDYDIDVQEWSLAYRLALRDKNTCIYSMSKSAERTPLFVWIGAITHTKTALYSLRDRNDVQLTTLKDAKQYVTAVTRDDISHHYLLKNGFKEGEQLYVIENVSSLLNLLNRRQDIDLVVLNDTILKYRAAESGIDMASLQSKLDLPDLPLDFHLACHLKMPIDLTSRLQTSLQQLKETGEFAKIVADWSELLK